MSDSLQPACKPSRNRLSFLRYKARVPSNRLLMTGLPLLTAAYLLPIVWILYRMGDDGTLISGAQRVAEGAVPGRDFLEAIGPGSFYSLALFFKVLGFGWTVTRVYVLSTGVLSAALLYAIAREVCTRMGAVLLWLFIVVMGVPLWPIVSHHWDSNLFALAAIWSYLKIEKTGRPAWAVAAGTLLGLTTCIMQQKGVFLLLGLIASGVVCGMRSSASSTAATSVADAGRSAKWDGLWLMVGSFSLVVAGVLSFYWSAGALSDLYYANVTWPLSSYGDINRVFYGRMLRSVATAPAYAVMGPDRAVLRLLSTGLSMIPFLLLAALPILVAGPVLGCLLTAEKRRLWLGGPLVTLTFAGAATWVSEMHRPDIFHLAFGSPVLLIVLFAGSEKLIPTKIRKLLAATLAAGLIAFGSLNLMTQLRDTHPVETRRGIIQSVSGDDAIGFLSTSVEKRAFVFVYPYYPIYYYLADIRNPTRFSILLYGYNTPEQFDEVIRNLEDKHVPYVLWDQIAYGDNLRTWFPAYRHPSDDKLKLEHYLLTHYELIAIKSNFRILQRRNGEGQGAATPSQN